MTPRPLGWFDADGDGAEDFERQKRYAAFTALFNVTGQPAVSVPLYWTAAGLPIGRCSSGRPADEATLLSLSAQVEAARPWAHRHPDGWELTPADPAGCAGRLSAVTVAETILVFAGIPLAHHRRAGAADLRARRAQARPLQVRSAVGARADLVRAAPGRPAAGHGAHAAPRRPAPPLHAASAGPLGGARGTW